ncbi:MAG: hypothetical protein OEZ14_07105, partial [Acidimicrobiia bacterium]|nr:hypothetical protein [Acidimicrobiia bacterium]
HWMFDQTGLNPGDVIPGIVGSEIDRRDPNQPLPAHLSYTVLAESPYAASRGPTTQHTTIYQAPSGAWVFASGTLSWSWGLGRAGHTSPALKQMTRNLFDRFIAGDDDSGDSGSGDQPVSVRVRGVTGEELVRLYDENGLVITERQVTGTQWQTISATVLAGSRQLHVGFVNDAISSTGADRNLLVDAVTWERTGETVQAETVESRGVWNGTDCGVGYRNSEFLACNGWFRFPVPASDDNPETSDEPDDPDDPGTGTATVDIVVTARGTTGTETLELEVDGTVVDQWTPATTFAERRHVHTGPMPGLVRVLFTNDGRDAAGRDRNSIVQTVAVGDQVFNPIDARSKGVWNGTDCGIGFRQSTFLACNGWFEFIVEPSDPGDPGDPGDPPPTTRTFTARLRGTTGTELATIEVDGVVNGPYPVASIFTELTLDLPADGVTTIRVGFVNDAIVNGADRNLIVDRLTIDGSTYAAATLVARGVWDGTSCKVEKVHGTGYLACNGWVQLTLSG